MAWSYLSKIEEEKKSYPKALEYMKKAIQLDGDVYEYLIDQGLLQQRLGKTSEALVSWRRATEVRPTHFLGFAFLGKLQDDLGYSDDAYRSFQQVVKLNPAYHFAWISMGIISWQRQNWPEVRQDFAEAWKADKNNVSYPLMINAAYIKEGDLRSGKEVLQQAMRTLDKQSAEYAVVRLYFDSVEQGIVAKVLNVENKTDRYKLLYYLALYYEGKGETMSALKFYEQVRQEGRPSFFEYRMNNWALESLASAKPGTNS